MEFLHALYTNMTKTAVLQVCCTIIINFASFGINIMNMCHSYWVYDHRRFYSCKQNNNYSLTYMNNRIAINMIQPYSCSTQTPNNIYLGSTLIPKVERVCDSDHIIYILSSCHDDLQLHSEIT